MRLEFLFLGRTRESYLAAGVDDFVLRLKRYAPVEIKTLKERQWSPREQSRQMQVEGEQLLAAVMAGAFLVALDPLGQALTSEQLAAQVGQWQDEGRRQLTFVLGGPLGLPPAVRQRADYTLSLSKMTFTHEMARLLLLEQIYRAYAILAGSQYHK